MINSVIKFAALVCFCTVCGGESVCEDDEDPDHACRKGEGTTGAVGLAGVPSRTAVDDPFSCWARVVIGLAAGGRNGVGEPLDTGNGKAEVLLGEGSGAGDRNGRFEVLPIVPALLIPLWTEEELCASSPTLLRLASGLGTSLGIWLSFNTKRSEEGREGPNADDEYRLRERVALALPIPSHLYTPLGFLDSVFLGDGVGAWGDRVGLIPFVFGRNGELSRTGVDSLEENRKGSGLLAVKISIYKKTTKGKAWTAYEEYSVEEELRYPQLLNC